MTRRSLPTVRPIVLSPLFLVGLLAIVLIPRFDGVPELVKGFVTGVGVALLIAYVALMAATFRAAKQAFDQKRLDDLDPLGGPPRADRPEDDR